LKPLRAFIFFLTAGVFFLAGTSSWADPAKPYDSAYASGAGRKLERGVSNLTAGWMEIPREITLQGKQNGIPAACFWGPIKGLGQAVARTAAGAYETLTFPLPTHPSFTPLVQPEFVLDKDSAGTK